MSSFSVGIVIHPKLPRHVRILGHSVSPKVRQQFFFLVSRDFDVSIHSWHLLKTMFDVILSSFDYEYGVALSCKIRSDPYQHPQSLRFVISWGVLPQWPAARTRTDDHVFILPILRCRGGAPRHSTHEAECKPPFVMARDIHLECVVIWNGFRDSVDGN